MSDNTEPVDGLYSRYNTDDVFDRVVTAGLLNLMNNKIVYDQVWQDDVIEKVTLPTMYDFAQSGDERFAQDNYTFFGNDCFGTHMITGKFDMFPRCAISLTSTKIDSANITNRFVKGSYMSNENGRLTTYQTFLYSIPLTYMYQCTVWCSTMLEKFKIGQSIREVFYKNRTFSVIYRGMKLKCCAGFPEDVNDEKITSYSFDSERQHKLSFNIAVECYQPVFDESMKIDAANRIENIAFDISHTTSDSIMPKRRVSVKLHSIDKSVAYPAGSNMKISWTYSSNISEVPSLILSYINEDGKEFIINRGLENSGDYVWNIPIELSTFVEPGITYPYPDSDNYRIIKEPVFRIVPSSDNTLTEDSFYMMDPGQIIANSVNINMFIDYIDDKGKLVTADNYYLNIVNGYVDESRPVIIADGTTPMKYTKKYSTHKISLKLTYPMDDTVYDQIDNILII